MPTKITLALLLVVCLVSVLVFLVLPDGEDLPTRLEPVVAGAPESPEAGDLLADGAEEDDGPAAGAGSTRTVATESDAAPPGPWAGQLAGITGRLVEVDGTPVPDLFVALFKVDGTLLVRPDWERLGEEPPALQLDATRADEEGRFVLDGAFDGAFHGLGIDLGGPRSTLRVVDQSLHHGERTDLGDIVLSAYAVVTGRVLDDEGRPLAGARVRMAPVPDEVLEVGIHNWRRGALLTMGGQEIIEIPAWLEAHLDTLPVPTTFTASDGKFRLAGVPLTEVVGAVDKAGWAGIPLDEVDVAGGDLDVGDLVMSRGRTARGVVVDGQDLPVAGLEVFFGAIDPGVGFGLLHPCGATRADGKFSLTGLPAEGALIAATRRSPYERWIRAVQEEPGAEVRLRIPTVASLTVHVKNAAGEPIVGADLGLRPTTPHRGFGDVAALMMLAQPGTLPSPGFREEPPGTYRCATIPSDEYLLEARAEGYAPTTTKLEHAAEGSEVTLTCEAGRTVLVTVVDGLSRRPIEKARASILLPGDQLVSSVAVGWTDAKGMVALGPYQVGGPSPSGIRQVAGSGPSPEILVEHPQYANRVVPLEASATEVAVSLWEGGALDGTIHWGGATPTRPYMVILEFRDADGLAEIFHMPRFGRSDLEGRFRFTSLPEGEHRVEIFERFLNDDPLKLARDEQEPTRVFRGEVQITLGRTSELVVDLSPSGMGPTGRVIGTVHVNGRPLEGARVRVNGNQDVRLVTDRRGAFDTGEISVLRGLWISIEGEVEMLGGGGRMLQLHGENVTLEAGELHEITIDYQPLELPVLVVDAAGGNPVEDARVIATPKGQGGSWRAQRNSVETNAGGEATVLLLQPGAHHFEVSHPEYTLAHNELDVTADRGLELHRFELVRSVPCAGRVLTAGEETTGRGWCHLRVRSTDGRYSQSQGLRGNNLAFDLKGLGPGTYRANIWVNGQGGEEVAFELGPRGARDLVLTYTPDSNR